MTIQQMLDKLNTDRSSPYFEIFVCIKENKMKEAENCIKQYFNCDDETASKVSLEFKKQFCDIFQVSEKEAARINKEWAVHKPKCPTCGSTKVEKISLTKKAIGGAMFGLFSSNVRNTMCCRNCGHKW